MFDCLRQQGRLSKFDMALNTGMETLSSVNVILEDPLTNRFNDDDVEETIVLEELEGKQPHFLEINKRARFIRLCHLTFFQRNLC